MASEGADHLLEKLYVAWLASIGAAYDPTCAGDSFVARSRTEQQVTAFGDTLAALVRLLWHERATVEDSEEVTRGIGYSPSRAAIWCPINELQIALKVNQPEGGRGGTAHALQQEQYGQKAFDLFRPQRPFSRMSAHLANAAFWRRAASGSEIHLLDDAHVDAAVLRIASTELKRGMLGKVRIPGLPIGGVRGGVLWIGFRTEQEIRLKSSTVEPGLALPVILRDRLTQAQRADMIAGDFASATTVPAQRRVSDTRPLRKAGALRMDPMRRDEALFLQTATALQELGLVPVPLDLIGTIMGDFTGTILPEANSHRCKEALRNLEHDHFIEQDPRASKRGERALLSACTTTGEIGDMRPELIAWLMRNQERVEEDDWKTLLGAGAISCMADNPVIQREIVTAIKAVVGSTSTRYVEYAHALTKDGELDLALECLEHFAGVQQFAYEAWAALGTRALTERSVEGLRALRSAFLNGGAQTIHELARTMATRKHLYLTIWAVETLKQEGHENKLRTFEDEIRRLMPTGDAMIDNFFMSWFGWNVNS
jgi:hypothetical protein